MVCGLEKQAQSMCGVAARRAAQLARRLQIASVRNGSCCQSDKLLPPGTEVHTPLDKASAFVRFRYVPATNEWENRQTDRMHPRAPDPKHDADP